MYRKDYSHDPDAPDAYSLTPAVAAAIVDGGRIVMVRRTDSGNWSLPGGTVELNENLTDCVLREVHEETGLLIEVDTLIGTYSDPGRRIAYGDGEVRREFCLVYLARRIGGALTRDSESTDIGWYALDELSNLDLAESQKQRLVDLRAFLRDREPFLR